MYITCYTYTITDKDHFIWYDLIYIHNIRDNNVSALHQVAKLFSKNMKISYLENLVLNFCII